MQPMLATIAATLPVGERWSYEVKWDGYRALLIKDDRRTRLLSRNLKDLSRDYAHICSAAGTLTRETAILDGEVVALDEEGRPAFQALQHRTAKRTAVVFYAFDLLQLAGADLRKSPLSARRRALAGLQFAAPILLSTPLPGTARDIERAVRDAGLEGVVAKRVDSIYESGRRSRSWIKVRFGKRQEFVVGGYKPGTSTFDSVLAGYFEGRRLLHAGKVRAGFTPRLRADLFELIRAAPLEECPFADLPNSTGRSHWGEGITLEEMPELRWVEPRVVIEVAFTEWTAGGNLRHASIVGVRHDKSPRAVRRET